MFVNSGFQDNLFPYYDVTYAVYIMLPNIYGLLDAMRKKFVKQIETLWTNQPTKN